MAPQSSWMKRYRYLLILGGIILIGLILRVSSVSAPLADFHSWRQVESLEIAEAIITDRSFGAEESTHYIEFPLYNAVFAGLSMVLPWISLSEAGRIVSILLSMITVIALFFLVRKEHSDIAAIATAALYATLPFSVFFSRTILPEIPAITLAVLALTMLAYNPEKRDWQSLLLFIGSAVCYGIAVATKPTTIVFCIPLVTLLLRKMHVEGLQTVWPYLYGFIALLPFALWFTYLDFPVLAPDQTTLFHQIPAEQESSRTIYFSTIFFQTVFYERIALAILGAYLLVPVVLGALAKKKTMLWGMLGLSALFFIFVFQGGNIQFTYYQVIILPIITIYAGIGVDLLWKTRRYLTAPIFSFAIIFAVVAAGYFFSHGIVKGYYTYSQDLVQIADIVSTITEQDARIVTDQAGDTTLLYLADRTGTAYFDQTLSQFREEGYDYFITANSVKTESLQLNQEGEILFSNDQFILLAL